VVLELPGNRMGYIDSAFHEAGHAIVGRHLALTIKEACVRADGSGEVIYLARSSSPFESAVTTMAGGVAQSVFLRRGNFWNLMSNGDVRNVLKDVENYYGRSLENWKECYFIRHVSDKAKGLVEELWPQIVEFSKHLLRERTLKGAPLERAFRVEPVVFRYHPTRAIENFTEADGYLNRHQGSNTIHGYAATFDKLTPKNGFLSRFREGAFARAIQEKQDVRALINHDPSLLLGRTKSGTLRLVEDGLGLAVEIDPPNTRYSEFLTTAIRRGDISEMSIAYRVLVEEWSLENGEYIRDVVDLDLIDVSAATYAADSDSSLGLRAKESFCEVLRMRASSLERRLRYA